MSLLIWSIIVSFSNMFSIKFVPKVISWLLDYVNEDHKIISELSVLKKEQSEIFIVKEFAKHAKLQRRINKLNEQLKDKKFETASKNIKIKLACKVSLYVLSAILNLLFIRYNYSQTVLNELPSSWFSPISWLVSWPSSQIGTMSFLFWYAVTNCVASVAANSIL